jgi:hypothetical protein
MAQFLITFGDASKFPCVNFTLESGDIARTDADRCREFTTLDAPTQRNAIAHVTERNKRLKCKKLLHGVSLEVATRDIEQLGYDATDSNCEIWEGK